MSPKSKRTRIPPQKYTDYLSVAHDFYRGADVAKEFEYRNAAGVLIVHSAIAYADAITIKIGGVKNRDEDHMTVADLIREYVLLDENGKRAVGHLTRLIDQKNEVSYSGEAYSRKDLEDLWKHLDRFRHWALMILN